MGEQGKKRLDKGAQRSTHLSTRLARGQGSCLRRIGLLAACLVAQSRIAKAELVATDEAIEMRSSLVESMKVQLRLRVAVRSASEPQSVSPPTMVLPLTEWKRNGDDWTSEPRTRLQGLSVVVHAHSRPDGATEFHFVAKITAKIAVRLLSLEFETESTAPDIAGRDLKLRRAGKKVALLGLDPKWVILRAEKQPWTFVSDDTVDGMKVQVLPKSLLVQADVLNSETRPFFYFQQCTEHWRAPNRKAHLDTRELQPGDMLTANIMAYPGMTVPLLKARFPENRRAALVVTDHADQTTTRTFLALMGGTSDANSPRFGKGGFLGHGLLFTKALWWNSEEPAPVPSWIHGLKPQLSPFQKKLHTLVVYHNRYDRSAVDSSGAGRPQLDDPKMVQWADKLHAGGVELGPHSATPQSDDRESTEAALRFFDRYESRTWIDHQPYTNCEALTNRGFQSGTDGIADLLERHGYRYAWSGIDVPPSPSLNLLKPQRSGEYVPVLYPSGRLTTGGPDNLWFFSTMMTYVENNRFFALYKKKSMDLLEEERGLHIAHTYLETFHPPGSKFYRRNLMVPGKNPGEIVPDPRLERLFAQWASRVKQKTLWMPTLLQLGDHTRAMSQVVVRLNPDGAATLTAQAAIKAASFVLPRADLSVFVDGIQLKSAEHGKKETMFHLDLEAGKTVRVEFKDAQGKPFSLLRAVVSPTLIAQARRGTNVIR